MSETEERGEVGEETDNIGEYYGKRNTKYERHSYGHALLPNRDRYTGQYRKGLRHGRGLYVFRNGARYDGTYRKGVKHGMGTFWYPDGSKYEGDWKRDRRHGFGAYYYANGDVYEGHWRKGVRDGLGTFRWGSNKDIKFLGIWKSGKMDGPGQLIYPTHRYYGNFKNNLPFGRGCYSFEGVGIQHGYYVHIKDPNFDIENQPLPTDENKEEEYFEAQKGVVPIWRARRFTEFEACYLPKDALPETSDSVSTSPDEDDSDTLPEPDTEDEEALEEEVGAYRDSKENVAEKGKSFEN